MTFGFRRLRLRSSPHPEPIICSVEEDSDESSPERRDKRHIVHIVAPRNARKSAEPLLSSEVSKTSHDAAECRAGSAHIALSLDKGSQAEHPSNKLSRSGRPSVTCPNDPVIASPKPTLIRRVTSKLMISIPSKSGAQTLRTRPSTPTLPTQVGSPTRSKAIVSPTLPNSIISKGNREAALRERGLLPPRKDLSEQEREADARLRCFPSPAATTRDGLSEAARLKASWFATNRSSESSDSEWRPPAPPYLQSTRSHAQSLRTSSSSSVLLEADALRRSGESGMDQSPARLSTCSSCPPLSSSSNLEVLHEEPSEQSPITPPLPRSPLIITVSNANDPLPSPVIVDSPVSGTFSSHGPMEKETMSLRASRRSCERSHRVVGRSLSTMGTRSLTNLRRSIVGSLRLPSSSTLSTADVPPTPTSSNLAAVQAPRTAISPTIHSLGSILWETKDIKDVESRRLSELAFLD